MASSAFSGWAGPRNPKLLIIGEAWGENEWMVKQPFVGSSGELLWGMLGQAIQDVEPELHRQSHNEYFKLGPAWVRNRSRWLEAAGIAYTNVINLQPPGNKIDAFCCTKKELQAQETSEYRQPALARGLYLRPQYLPEVDRLLSELATSRPNCILATGNTPSWALLHTTNISAIRGAVSLGYTDPQIKVVPTYHPAAILRQWSWRPIGVADIIKAYREAQYPELIRPERTVLINPTIHDLIGARDRLLAFKPSLVAADIETQWKQIRCIGFASASDSALVIPFIDPSKPGANYWSTFEEERETWQITKTILESTIPKLFQNGMYDLQYIVKMGIRPQNCLHDTMLLHHSLFPEMRKSLGFLGSIYTNEQSWKLMGRPKADTVKRDE